MKKIITIFTILLISTIYNSNGQLISEVDFSGNVFHDINGNTDNQIDGGPLPFNVTVKLSGYNINLDVFTSGSAVTSNPNTNGNYGYYLISALPGQNEIFIDPASIPPGWEVTSAKILHSAAGEDAGGGGFNFGVSKIPEIPLNGEEEFLNPNGAYELNIPLSTFAANDDGIIQKIIIFGGTGYTKITINGIVYDSTNPIPANGVEVITGNSGGKVAAGTVLIDPTNDGSTSATINYKVVDNANLTSNLGTVTLNLTTPFTSLCNPITSSNSLGLSLNIPQLPFPGSEFPLGLPLLQVNSQYEPISLGISRDPSTAFFMGISFGGFQNPYFRYYLVYRQNNIWRFSTLTTATVYNTFTNFYQCTAGSNDAFPPCDATWEAVTGQSFICNVTTPSGPGCLSYPNWPTVLSTSISNTITNVNIPQPCTFVQNNPTTIGTSTVYLWNDPANWSCGAVPTSTSAIFIPAGVSVTLNGNINSSSLLNNGTIDLNGFNILP
jgi:hypothetical protein